MRTIVIRGELKISGRTGVAAVGLADELQALGLDSNDDVRAALAAMVSQLDAGQTIADALPGIRKLAKLLRLIVLYGPPTLEDDA
jgi:hypothetical protein